MTIRDFSLQFLIYMTDNDDLNAKLDWDDLCERDDQARSMRRMGDEEDE
jgi:hypothetical protein